MDISRFLAVFILVMVFITGALLSANIRMTDTITGLDAVIAGMEDEMDLMEEMAFIVCEDSFLSAGGKNYVLLSANASSEGVVLLTAENVADDAVRIFNLREAVLVYDAQEGSFSRSGSVTFSGKNGSSCGGIIYPGESIVCRTEQHSSDVSGALDNGANTFVIEHILADIDVRPYTAHAGNLCVRF